LCTAVSAGSRLIVAAAVLAAASTSSATTVRAVAVSLMVAAAVSATTVATAISATAPRKSIATSAWTAFLESVVGLFDGLEKADAHGLGILNLSWIRTTTACQYFLCQTSHALLTNLRNMQVHRLIALVAGIVLHEPAPMALDLNSAPRLGLDVLHVAPSSSHDLRTQVEAIDGLKVNGNTLFWPLATTEMIALNGRLLLLVPAAEPTLVH